MTSEEVEEAFEILYDNGVCSSAISKEVEYKTNGRVTIRQVMVLLSKR